jgi:hypothetical protein
MTPRLTPSLRSASPLMHHLRCGENPRNFPAQTMPKNEVNGTFPYMAYYKNYPPYMGVWFFGIVRPISLKLTFLSTRGDGFPQFYPTYPQFLGRGANCCLNKYPNMWGCPEGIFRIAKEHYARTFLPKPFSARILPSSKAVFPRKTTLRTLPFTFQPSNGVQPQRVNCSAALTS